MTLPFDCLHFDSISEYGHYEACKHKYLLSKAAGRDLGAKAYRAWFVEHWVPFYHHRWIQHLYGKQKFPEFDQPGHFGRIQFLPDGRVLAGSVELCPVAVGFVQRQFLREHRPWEILTFTNNSKEIGQLGFNYEEVRKVLIEFGINECRISWDRLFAVDECRCNKDGDRHNPLNCRMSQSA